MLQHFPGTAGRFRVNLRRSVLFSATVFTLWSPTHAGAQEDPIRLEGFIVTAGRVPRSVDDLASHVTVLDGEALREEGIFSVSEALRDVPGLVVQQSGSFGSVSSVFFRGGESDYVLVLVDGVQVNQPGGAIDFSSLTTDNVERIEVIRGPASALFGSDAVSGVIQIITRTGDGAPRASVMARAGSYGRREWMGELSGGYDLARYGFSLSQRSTDGILKLNNQSRITAFSGSVRLAPNRDTWARISARYTDREFHFPTDERGNVVDRNAFTFGDEMALSLDAGRRLASWVELRALLTLSELDTGTDDAPDGPADTLGYFGFASLSDVRRTAADLHVNLNLRPGTVVTLGGEVEEESERSTNESLSDFGPSSGWSEHRRQNLAFFTQAVADVGGVATSLAGRLEDNERFGRFFTYQAGFSYAVPAAGLRFRASFGRAVKEPTFFENFATGFALGNPDLDPERSLARELGLEQELLRGRVSLSATFFTQSFTDLIQYTFSPPGPGDPNFFNVAEASARGAELTVGVRFGPFNGGVGYTYLDTEVVDSGFDQGSGATFVEGERLLRRPTHLFSVSGAYALGHLGSLNAGVRFVGNRDDRDFSTWPAAPVLLSRYTVVDLGATFTLVAARDRRPGLALLIRGENLLGERYQEAFGFPAPGRGVYAGARVTFGGS
ncbi:TonB-dependent receptor plug domain-containing protein [Gemmatimonadota bacterium]